MRASDATGRIPAEALVDEARWLAERPLIATADDWAMHEPATVTPMGTVRFGGTSYFASARLLGAPATLLVRAHTIEVVVGNGKEVSIYARADHTGEVRRLPHHRQEVLAVVHGHRKIATFRRQCLLELGQPAWDFLGVLVHRCPAGRWEEPCSDLFDLLTLYGDDALRDALAKCVEHNVFRVDDVRRVLAEAA